MTTAEELTKCNTLEELRDVARLYKINNFSKLKKADLANLLINANTEITLGESMRRLKLE